MSIEVVYVVTVAEKKPTNLFPDASSIAMLQLPA